MCFSSLTASELTVYFTCSGKETAPPPSPAAAISFKAGLEEEPAAVTVKPDIDTEASETAADAGASLALRLAAVLKQAVTEEQRREVAGHMVTWLDTFAGASGAIGGQLVVSGVLLS